MAGEEVEMKTIEQEALLEWVEELRTAEKAIVVEGKKDKVALEQLGIMNTIFILSKHPLHQVVEEIAQGHKEVIILMDFDQEGKELYGKLSKYFSRLGVRVDHYFREFLQKNTKVSHIEGFATYLQHRQGEKSDARKHTGMDC